MPAFCIRAVYKLSYRGISSGEDGDWGGNVVWTCFERRLISFGRDEQRFLLFFFFCFFFFFFFFSLDGSLSSRISLSLLSLSKFCTLSFGFPSPYDVFSPFLFLFILCDPMESRFSIYIYILYRDYFCTYIRIVVEGKYIESMLQLEKFT